MCGGVIHQASGVRPSKSLVVRGGLVRIFSTLAGFLVVTFLCWGIYTIEDLFLNPLSAGDAAVIDAAFVITLAAMLLLFLIKPGKGLECPARAAHLIPRFPRCATPSIPLPGPCARIIYGIIWRINVSTSIIPASGSRLIVDSGARNGRKVALFQDDAVVHLVARGDKSQRAHGHFLLIGQAAARPDIFLERTKQADTRAAHGSKLLGKACERPLAKRTTPHVVILLESGKRRLIGARKPQRPVSKNALGIRDVPENFLYRPFSGRIPEASVPLASSRKQLQHL